LISSGTPKAKAVCWDDPDTERRKRGEQKGLDTAIALQWEFEIYNLKFEINLK